MECLDNDDDSDSELIGLVEPHADLLSGTQALLHQGAIKVILVHVKGHQDRKTPTALAHNTTLNIDADMLAKDKLVRF